MFKKLGFILSVALGSALVALPASAQLEGAGDGIVAGFSALTLIATSVVTALIAFGVAWYLGKKVYTMTKA